MQKQSLIRWLYNFMLIAHLVLCVIRIRYRLTLESRIIVMLDVIVDVNTCCRFIFIA